MVAFLHLKVDKVGNIITTKRNLTPDDSKQACRQSTEGDSHPVFPKLRCAVAVGHFRCLPGLAVCSTLAIEICNSKKNVCCTCQIFHWCAISGCIFLLWGRFWRICWGHQSFAHVSSTFRHRPGHLRLSANIKPADCRCFGNVRLFWPNFL